jgi:hypothetical protein
MKLPKRIDTHVTETASGDLCSRLRPRNESCWRSRNAITGSTATSRSAKGGHITGELVSAQLKGVGTLASSTEAPRVAASG